VTELDVLIVGSGPAGVATGIALRELAPLIADRTLCIDKAVHPRDKTCGGGLTGHMVDELRRLGVEPTDVPHVAIERVVGVYDPIKREVPLQRPFYVIRRRELDARLAQELLARDIMLSEGESYIRHERRSDGRLNVQTSAGQYVVKCLVAANGAGSKIARAVEKKRRPKVHLAQFDVPLPASADPNAMVYDFSAVTGDLFGYTWVFPTPLRSPTGGPMANVGVMQVGPTRAGGGIPTLMRRELLRHDIDIDDARVNFHPEWAFDPSFRFSAPNILTVGDAAGIDPLFGEGLSQCLEYGWLAAEAIVHGLPADDLSFASYRRAVLSSDMGREMTLMRIPAQRFYRPGNEVWASFVFKNDYLIGLMAEQGENRTRLHHRIPQVLARAGHHLIAGDKRLPPVQ
jgi:flavin-dependent dehydrogenase